MTKTPEELTPIPNWEDQGCFACGAANAHGLQMKFYTDHEKVYSFLKVPETMIGWNRIVHGGVISTILDETMGWAAIHLFKQLGVTQTITVDFKKPVTAGEPITVMASVEEKVSGSVVRMSADIRDAGEAVCASARGQFKMIPPKAAVRMGIVGKDYMKTFGPILDVDGAP